MRPYDFEAAKQLPTGRLIDDLLQLRTARQRYQKRADQIKEDEKELEMMVISCLLKAETTSMKGKRASFSLRDTEVPQVIDWPLFYQYMKQHDMPHLLQRRVSVANYLEVADDGNFEVPGVKTVNVMKATLSAT